MPDMPRKLHALETMLKVEHEMQMELNVYAVIHHT